MGGKRMLIIITRMYTNQGDTPLDEFVEQNFFNQQNPNQLHAVFPQIPNNQTERIVVVIHGYNGRFNDPENEPGKATELIAEAIRDAISSISVNVNEFTIGILFHPHYGWRNFPNRFPQMIKDKLKKQKNINITFVQQYSSSMEGYDKVQKLAQAVRTSSFEKEFDDVWDFFVKKPPIEMSGAIRRLSILKHRIAHLFLPIDIDLQGLTETGFKQEYWDEVVEAWKGGKALDTLRRARQLLYGTGDDQDTVEKIVEEAKRYAPEEVKGGVDQAWQSLSQLLPNVEEHPNAELHQILTDLGCREKRDDVQGKCQKGPNPFHQWFVQLIEALDELRDAIEQAEGGGSRRE